MKLMCGVDEPTRLIFFCPGCRHGHEITANGLRNSGGHTWTWNGSMSAPTFQPSLNIPGVCHSFITDGRIKFLNDCTHALVGQEVDIPDWDLLKIVGLDN